MLKTKHITYFSMSSQAQVQRACCPRQQLGVYRRLALGFGAEFFHGGFAPRQAKPGMNGLQRLAVENLHGIYPDAAAKGAGAPAEMERNRRLSRIGRDSCHGA